MKLTRAKLISITALFPLRRIMGREGDYLHRYYVAGSVPTWVDGNGFLPWLPFTIYVHRFIRADADRETHNHPWEWSRSFVVVGGYVEERLTKDGLTLIERKPGDSHEINHNTFHRVAELFEDDAWTIFITGPRRGSWGFMTKHGFVNWEHFINQREQDHE